MLKTTPSSENLSLLIVEHIEIGSIGGDDREDETFKRSPLTSKHLNRATGYLTSKARLAFIQLRKAFTKASILWHFDPECYIRIKIDV